MRAHQIMTRPVITVTPDTTIVEAAKIMLEHHISGLPVVDATGKLTGIVSKMISSAAVKSARSAGPVAGWISFSGRSSPRLITFANMVARSRKSWRRCR